MKPACVMHTKTCVSTTKS